MTVLAIETATNVCGAAVVADGRVIAEDQLDAPYMHSEKLMTLVDGVLHLASRTLATIDGIAVSIGPGSFTGLRIGLSTAKGLAYAASKPILAVSTLEALAFRAMSSNSPSSTIICPVIDARKDEVYCGGYRVEAQILVETLSPRAMRVSDLLDQIRNEHSILFVGDGTSKVRLRFDDFGKEILNRVRFIHPPDGNCSSGSVGLLGERHLIAGKLSDLASLEPLYIKEFSTSAVHEQAPMNP